MKPNDISLRDIILAHLDFLISVFKIFVYIPIVMFVYFVATDFIDHNDISISTFLWDLASPFIVFIPSFSLLSIVLSYIYFHHSPDVREMRRTAANIEDLKAAYSEIISRLHQRKL